MTVAVARAYRQRGWAVVPVPVGQKAPVRANWNTITFTPEDFSSGDNVGVIVGERSGWLVDNDLDCDEALELAPLYLPMTGAIFGRASRPMSHWLYIAPDARFETFTDPLADGKNTVVEMRSDAATGGGAHQTIFPPSIVDGERREWHGSMIAPLVVTAAGLRRQVARLAVGCLVMRYVSPSAGAGERKVGTRVESKQICHRLTDSGVERLRACPTAATSRPLVKAGRELRRLSARPLCLHSSRPHNAIQRHCL
jgi:hypothetical protein